MLILPCLAVLYLPTLHPQHLQTRTMHYPGTSRILFHIHIGVISKAITEHDPDLCYMTVFTFLSSQPRYNSRAIMAAFFSLLSLAIPMSHFPSFIHQFFSPTTHEQKAMLVDISPKHSNSHCLWQFGFLKTKIHVPLALCLLLSDPILFLIYGDIYLVLGQGYAFLIFK